MYLTAEEEDFASPHLTYPARLKLRVIQRAYGNRIRLDEAVVVYETADFYGEVEEAGLASFVSGYRDQV